MRLFLLWMVLIAALYVPHAQCQEILTDPSVTLDLRDSELSELLVLLSSQSYKHTKKHFPKQVYRFGRAKSLAASGITIHVTNTPLTEVLTMLRAEYKLCAWRCDWRLRAQPAVSINFGYCDQEPPFHASMKGGYQAYP